MRGYSWCVTGLCEEVTERSNKTECCSGGVHGNRLMMSIWGVHGKTILKGEKRSPVPSQPISLGSYSTSIAADAAHADVCTPNGMDFHPPQTQNC